MCVLRIIREKESHQGKRKSLVPGGGGWYLKGITIQLPRWKFDLHLATRS